MIEAKNSPAGAAARQGYDSKDREKEARSRTLLFSVVSTLTLLGIMLLFLIFTRLEVFSSNPHIVFALFLGVVATILVGVGLMALIFHSARSGHDDKIV